jgi:hypothetical protein
MNDPINDGDRKTQAARGSLIAYLSIFLGDMRSIDFSAILQVDDVRGHTR